MSNEAPIVDAGGGGGVAGGNASLAGMWRDVYRKAGEVAERIGRSLVDSHVYHYHRAPAGGAGAGWVLLDSHTVVTTNDWDSFTGIPGTYRDLRVVIDGRAVSGSSGTPGETFCRVRMHCNGDSELLSYRSTIHYGLGAGTIGGSGHTAGGDIGTGPPSNTNYSALVGVVPSENATDAGAGTTGVIDLLLYSYARTDRYKHFVATNSLTGDSVNGAQLRHAAGEWRSTAAITTVFLAPSPTDGWAAGTIARLYGWSDGA